MRQGSYWAGATVHLGEPPSKANFHPLAHHLEVSRHTPSVATVPWAQHTPSLEPELPIITQQLARYLLLTRQDLYDFLDRITLKPKQSNALGPVPSSLAPPPIQQGVNLTRFLKVSRQAIPYEVQLARHQLVMRQLLCLKEITWRDINSHCANCHALKRSLGATSTHIAPIAMP